MSTRSQIGIVNADGSVDSIYCHSDGYPSWNGVKLTQHYATEARVRALIALGGLSSLQDNIAPAPGVPHRFLYSLRAANVTVAYHRDRGEALDIEWHRCVDALAEWLADSDRQYLYLFEKGAWRCWQINYINGALQPEQIPAPERLAV